MNRRQSVLTGVMVLGCFLALGSEAAAQGHRASFEEGPPVRRKLLYRSSRFELMPQVGFTLNDTYKRNLLVGADASFYLTNEFGLGVSVGYGAVALNTDLLDQIEGTIGSDVQQGLSYATTQLLVDGHVSYVPIFGKFAIARTVVDYDIHLIGGFGGAIIAADGNNAAHAAFTGFKPGPVVGGGARMFLADSIALTVDLKDYIYSTADVQEGPAAPQSELRGNLVFMLGASFFFPGDVPVSR